jgi:hypothetical protein
LKHFKLVSHITHVWAAGIRGEAEFERMPAFGGLEALAQLAALHVRQGLDFQRQAFLLKVDYGRWPTRDVLQGCYRLSAERRGESNNAFAYHGMAQGPGSTIWQADLLIGTTPYDSDFRQDLLKPHYRRLFEKLRADGRKKKACG